MKQPTNKPLDTGDVVWVIFLLPLVGIYMVGTAIYLTLSFIASFLTREDSLPKVEVSTKTEDKEFWRGYNTSITDLLNEK